jgi:gluconate 5-dehydrogenase
MTDGRTDLPHALVVGASSGVGLALVERLAATHRVTGLSRRTDRLDQLANRAVIACYCDVANLESIGPAVERAVELNGRISALVYCAGVQLIRPMRATKVEDLRQVIDVNLTAALAFAAAMASQRISQPESVFCAVSSIAARRPEPAIIPYAAAKAGLEAVIKGLARELAPRRAVGVAPGWLDTEMTQSFKRIYTDAFREELEKRSPRGIATVGSIVDVIEFLISEKARYITGTVVTVDGGASL